MPIYTGPVSCCSRLGNPAALTNLHARPQPSRHSTSIRGAVEKDAYHFAFILFHVWYISRRDASIGYDEQEYRLFRRGVWKDWWQSEEKGGEMEVGQ